MKLSKQTIIFFFILVAVSTLVKLLCAPQINLSGFTAVIAVSLFAGLTIQDKKLAFLFPLLTLFITDVVLQVLYAVNLFPYSGFYSGQITNYILFILLTLVGIVFRNFKTAGIVAAAFIGPTVFFLLSNFVVWKTQAAIMGYNTDISGLRQSYTLGLPFYRNSLISTFIFLPAFIALYNRIMYGKFELAHAKN
ncbi:MAG TPA: DUF6580 family putative transport protein [Parafilimonas sp.]|nr:DUF6580 family putative transport protein [Parafilimonas sp.]